MVCSYRCFYRCSIYYNLYYNTAIKAVKNGVTEENKNGIDSAEKTVQRAVVLGVLVQTTFLLLIRVSGVRAPDGVPKSVSGLALADFTFSLFFIHSSPKNLADFGK